MAIKPRQLVAVIEAGGTKCNVTLAVQGRIVARTTAGAGNYTTLGLERTLERLKGAIQDALRQLPDELRPAGTCELPLDIPLFAALSVGMAGLDRQSDVEALSPRLAQLLRLDHSDSLSFIVGNDATLLSVPMLLDQESRSGIAIVSGTGSVGFSFIKAGSGLPVFHQRSGGYGHLLGDDGSGYHAGKLAIASALAAFDRNEPYTPFQHAVYKHFQCDEDPQLLLQRVYEEQSRIFPDCSSATRIASVCETVFKTAFEPDHQDDEATRIVRTVAQSVADLICDLLDDKIVVNECTLVLGGSLYRTKSFKAMVNASLAERNKQFRSVHVIDDAGASAALILAGQVLPAN